MNGLREEELDEFFSRMESVINEPAQPEKRRKVTKYLLLFMEEVSRMPEIPAAFWPKACRYGALICDAIEADEKSVRSEGGKKAINKRYSERRALLQHASSVALECWQNGSKLLHHEMKNYLVEEYQDQNNKHPFLNISEKSLLKTVKQTAKDMNLPHLISGQKKSS